MSNILRRVGAPLVAAAAAGAVVLAVRQLSSPEDDSPNARLRRAALDLLPDRYAVIPPPADLWDLILGGRRPDYLGGPAWGYYSTYAGTNPDGSKRKGGTTCGTVNAYLIGKAGWPIEMIDRLPTDPVPGSGFTPGKSISKVYNEARRLGWLMMVSGGAVVSGSDDSVILPGDYYCIVKDGAIYDGKPVSGEHVEVAIDVSDPNSNGERVVTSAAGGQKCNGHECAHWVKRTLRPDGSMVRAGESKRLAWIVRAA